jgi:hypothetical protein
MNQWAELNRLLFIYKLIGAVLACFCVLLVILCFVLSSRNPIVAVATDNDYFYFSGKKSAVDLNESNIKRFIEKYVRGFYEWKTLEPEKIAQEIAPLVTDGFKDKALFSLKEKKEKVFTGKTLRQDVSGLSVEVTKDSTTAVFDVILKVDGIPLVVPTQILFQLVKGGVNDWNPLGLYVNGTTVHEGK